MEQAHGRIFCTCVYLLDKSVERLKQRRYLLSRFLYVVVTLGADKEMRQETNEQCHMFCAVEPYP